MACVRRECQGEPNGAAGQTDAKKSHPSPGEVLNNLPLSVSALKQRWDRSRNESFSSESRREAYRT